MINLNNDVINLIMWTPRKSFLLTFWDKVNKKGTIVNKELGHCWEWMKRLDKYGYGRTAGKVNGKYKCYYVHRLSWELTKKEKLNKDILVLHKCDNTLCVNPDHLFLGTNKENKHDCMSKNRHIYGERVSLAKLTEEKVKNIFKLRNEKGLTHQSIADIYHVKQWTITRVLNRITWKHVRIE